MLFYICKKVLIDTLHCKDIQVAFVLANWTSLLRYVPYNVELFYYNRHKKFSNFFKVRFLSLKNCKENKDRICVTDFEAFLFGCTYLPCVCLLFTCSSQYVLHCTGRSQLSHVDFISLSHWRQNHLFSKFAIQKWKVKGIFELPAQKSITWNP